MRRPVDRQEPSPGHNLSELSFSSLSERTSIEESISFVYRHINALDRAGRRDLSIPLREIVDRMWERGSGDCPNPFVLRHLEKRTADAWATYLRDEQKASAPRQEEEPERFTFNGGKQPFSSGPSGVHISRFDVQRSQDGTSYSWGVSIRDNFADLGNIHAFLGLDAHDDIAGDARSIILGRERDFTGSKMRVYASSALGMPCEVQRSFLFHSAVEVYERISFSSSADADRFADHLRNLQSGNAASQEFLEHFNREGAVMTLERAGLPASDAQSAKEIMAEFGLRRSELIGYYREHRDSIIEACCQPGMSFEKLGNMMESFWEELRVKLRAMYPRRE